MTTLAYRIEVARVFAGLSTEPVFNGSIEHARIVIEEGLRAAQTHVRILTNKLDPLCYDDRCVMTAAIGYLRQPNAKLDILIEDPAASVACGAVLEKWKAEGGDKVDVRLVDPESVVDRPYNFMTFDERGYRFESDRSLPLAAVAGGPDHLTTTRNLIAIFDGLMAKASELPIPVSQGVALSA